MCRYALTPYKTHYACFACRKTFKATDRKQHGARKPCPQCGVTMTVMGKDFKAPPRKDVTQWRKVELLAAHGLVFGSCGCSGPGYAPRTLEAARLLVQGPATLPEGAQSLLRLKERHPR
ncbi:hypothetical protein [Deinococcus pimensis]|uniref:hypothetical protein n=1 Tax=Deinococcus pimensis TaxID=309888 RepID=UPI0004B48372|nr:hypothetical protein [Deinococcus pimensis]